MSPILRASAVHDRNILRQLKSEASKVRVEIILPGPSLLVEGVHTCLFYMYVFIYIHTRVQEQGSLWKLSRAKEHKGFVADDVFAYCRAPFLDKQRKYMCWFGYEASRLTVGGGEICLIYSL